MILLEAVELLATVVIIVMGLTQVVVPLLRNQRIFPAFRKVGKLQSALGEAEEDVQAAKIDKQVQRTRKQATRIGAEPTNKGGTK